ncbi:MAG: DUF4246 domain-containing protein [Akkermansiaceae bacterium]|nr:DUF4246 domain-containing protein [Akkermansiaceae bacterium]
MDRPRPRFADSSEQFQSKKFQWLPADVVVATDGTAKFLSYMNNVHPEWHAALYPATASLIERAIPLFERVLAAVAAPVRRAIQPPDFAWQLDLNEWIEQKTAENPDFDQDEAYDLYEEEKEFVEPQVPDTFEPPVPRTVSLRGRILQVCSRILLQQPPSGACLSFALSHVERCRRRLSAARTPLLLHLLQVIVKYASIVLTPEVPEYQGGVWHVEGMKNESIVASAVAYLRCDNITTSRLAFRSMVNEPDYEQHGAAVPFLIGEILVRQHLNSSTLMALCYVLELAITARGPPTHYCETHTLAKRICPWSWRCFSPLLLQPC